ncbi:uncharacterized protein LOC123316791 [Coccinella septempunctata]|uniref:uncharacterized protein LOC123316791 n=1 Tax=Coccinella septempunctata TaxID=41139 RepID=UPI001D0668E6|nr:uncharacterized protein LOC123316791 [Coccinella septempunctata]
MIVILITLLISIALFIVGVLLISSNEYENIKNNLRNRISEFSLQNSNGQILSSLEDLDGKLETLKNKLEEKKREVEDSKSEVYRTTEKIQALNETSKQVKLYYTGLKQDILKSEQDCRNLYQQIEEYKSRQNNLRKEVQENIRYYYDLLNAIQNCRFLERKDILKALPSRECFKS